MYGRLPHKRHEFGDVTMAATSGNTERLSIRLSSESKHAIAQAATITGQSISDFTVSIVLREAREVLHENHRTRLSDRDWKLFIEALEETDAEPNAALKAAAEQHEKRIVKTPRR